jgi:hypothetical protein
MELFRTLAQVATGTGPRAQPRPRSRFEETATTPTFDVVEQRADALASDPLTQRRPEPPTPTRDVSDVRDVGEASVVAPAVAHEDRRRADGAPGAMPVPAEKPRSANEEPPVVGAGPNADQRRPPASSAPAEQTVVHRHEDHLVVEHVHRREGSSPHDDDGDATRMQTTTAAERDGEPSAGRPPTGDRSGPLPVADPTSTPAAATIVPAPPPQLVPRESRSPSRPCAVPVERSHAAPPSGPAVVVHIGRLEVRTVTPPAAPTEPVPLRFAGPELDDFLEASR